MAINVILVWGVCVCVCDTTRVSTPVELRGIIMDMFSLYSKARSWEVYYSFIVHASPR